MSNEKKKHPVRVLLFDHTAELGGGEIALADLVKRFDRERVNPIVVLASHGPLEDLLRDHVPVHILPMAAGVVHARRDSLGVASLGQISAVRDAISYIRRLGEFIEQHEIEIIHTNSLKASVLGGIAGRLKRRKVVWHLRDRIADDYLPAKVVTVMRQLARILPHLVIGNSRATLETLHLSRTPTAIVPSGVDLAKFFVPEPFDGSSSGAAPRHSTIGIVGRICPWKGQHIFIEAAAKVHRAWPGARFQIIGAALFGEHDYDLELHRLVENAGLTEVVEFLGFQKNVAPLIRSLDILVHASVVGEPFGQVIVQGMASGKPVIATNGGGVPETVLDGDTGILVPMGDSDAMAKALCALLADPAAARRMGERARQRVLDHFTIEQTAQKVTGVYERVLARDAAQTEINGSV